MKRVIFICSIMTAVFIYFTTCDNPVIEKWWEGYENIEKEAAVPVIISHPRGAVYPIGAPAEAMTVTAIVSNGGKLSYQWYSNDIDSNEEGEIIQGATEEDYTPPTDQTGVTYYYVVVTSTISNGSEHKITTNAVSHTAGIDVDVNLVVNSNGNNNHYVINITGLSAHNKAYDGTTAATVTGIPVLIGITRGDDVTLVLGAAEFADASVGKNKAVILSGWSLGGADAGSYSLQMPVLMADIIKADPVVKWPSGMESTFARLLMDVKLPGNGSSAVSGTFAWVKPYDGTRLGKELYDMTFTPDDTLNYNTLTKSVEINTILIKMVKIPAGSFIMGSPYSEWGRDQDEDPQRQVTVNSFSMSECLVTQALYMYVMQTNIPGYFFSYVNEEEGTPRQLPMESISWYETLIFCNKLSMMEGLTPAYRIPAFNNSTDPLNWGGLPTSATDKRIAKWDTVEIVYGSDGYRLPTEAQWEYACRAGTTTAYNTGDTFSDDTGWSRGNSMSRTHKVGLKPANAWGLYDMHGNVNEFCWDWYAPYPYTPETDPVGPSSGARRVVRGGSCMLYADSLRSASRDELLAYLQSDVNPIGFRVVRP